jgi:chemotaxis protein CheZ
MGNNETSLGDFESTLKKHALELVESLEKGKFGDAVQLIHELNQTRDRGLYQEVGKLTRELHSAIVNFQIDPHMPQAEEVSQITDATERLSYVVRLTEGAANRTMDLVEQSTPLMNGLSADAKALSADWGRFMRREIGAEEFRDLARRVDGFLTRSEKETHEVASHLNDILLAQD